MIGGRFKQWLTGHASIYKVHPVNLGVFRILLGTGFLFQILVYLYPNIPVGFYHDAVIDQQTVKDIAGPLSYSIFDFFQSHFFVEAFFALAVILSVLLIIGYRSRLVAFLLLFVMWNIHQHGMLISGSESNYAMALLTAACFLPLNSTLTFKRFQQQHSYSERVYNILCAVLVIQIGWIYLVTGLAKSDPAWFNGPALDLVFTNDPLNSHMFWHGRDMSWTKPFSSIIPISEILLGLIIITYPSDKKWLRYLLGGGLAFLHISILVFLNLFQFTLYALAAAAVIFPLYRLKFFRNRTSGLDLRKAEDTNKFNWKFALPVLYIALISLINLQGLTRDSLVAPVMKKLKVRRVINIVRIPKIDNGSSLNQQWSLYGAIPDPFGCVTFIGEDEEGKIYDMIYGGERPDICCPRKSLAQKELLELFRILFFYQEFEQVEPIYDRLQSCYQKAWETDHPEIQLKDIDLRVYYFNDDGGEVVFDVLKEYGGM